LYPGPKTLSKKPQAWLWVLRRKAARSSSPRQCEATSIARLFLDAEATIGQRLSRAKTKISAAGIAYAVPEPEHWEDRLQAVLITVYLIFTTGDTSDHSSGQDVRDLCEEALFLGQMLLALCPAQPEIEGAVALMLLTDARRAARVSAIGATVPPAEQDRSLWDRVKEAQGRQLLETALRRRRAGPFQVKAAISACQMADPAPDWPQILQLYTVLLTIEPTPVVRVNHAVAPAENGHVDVAMSLLFELQKSLPDFQPLHAAHAAVLAKAGEKDGALGRLRQGHRVGLQRQRPPVPGGPSQAAGDDPSGPFRQRGYK